MPYRAHIDLVCDFDRGTVACDARKTVELGEALRQADGVGFDTSRGVLIGIAVGNGWQVLKASDSGGLELRCPEHARWNE